MSCILGSGVRYVGCKTLRKRSYSRSQKENPEAVTAGVKFLHLVDAIDEWCRVVQALKLGKEVEPTHGILSRESSRGGKTPSIQATRHFSRCVANKIDTFRGVFLNQLRSNTRCQA